MARIKHYNHKTNKWEYADSNFTAGGNIDYYEQPEAPDDAPVGSLWYDTDEMPPEESGGISITGAKVGQTVKISSVDENGVPTAWEPVDFLGSGKFELIRAVEITEVSSFVLDNLNLKRVILYFTIPEHSTFDGGAYRYINTLFYRGSTRRIVYTPIEDQAAIRRGIVEAEVVGRQVKAITTVSIASNTHLTLQLCPDASGYSIESDADAFTRIHINSQIPAGTKIEIYGVRA